MASRPLKKDEWQTYFDTFSKKHPSSLVNLEIIGTDVGDQTEIKWQPLKGISHDPHTDSVYILTDSIEHSILHPKSVELNEMNGSVNSIQVVDQDNNRQIIQLRDQPKTGGCG